jgi:O-antigen biosynthesis protein
MKRRPIRNVRLEPEEGNHRADDGQAVATSLPVWLRVEPIDLIRQCRWVRIRYASSFFDEPVRPVIRFINAAGKITIQPMNGPILGYAEWIGRIPDQTVSVGISPTRRLGAFHFRIESIEPLASRKLIRRAARHDLPWSYWSVRSRLLNSREEAWQALKYATGGTPMKQYAAWHTRMARPLDPLGLDRPRQIQHADAPHIRLLLHIDRNDTNRLRTTLQSLLRQSCRRWSLHAVIDKTVSEDVRSVYRSVAHEDARFMETAAAADQGRVAFADSDRLAVIGMGDTLRDYALAVVSSTSTEFAIIYSDEDAIDSKGVLHSPVLKPDWSPLLYDRRSYLGRPVFFQYGDILRTNKTWQDILFDEEKTTRSLVKATRPGAVHHIRRLLYCRSAERVADAPRVIPFHPQNLDTEQRWPECAIVIPTKNQAKLLRACTDGLKRNTDYPSFQVVIVDNGSTEPQTLSLLQELQKDPRFNVLRRPGPFNYSKLSNDGAALVRSPMLVFLNDDIEIIHAGWLKALVAYARQPSVGVVGAKLLFPNRKIQHAGVVLGMGGIAGHLYRRSAANEYGYLGQIQTPREVSAITAACIAIAHDKFDSVDGFDSANLPVDLNDMDLCLRISEKGWINIWTPDAQLIHLQSASRGIDRNPYDLYRQERSYFTRRWIESIRDDPYFHPGLSLFAHRPALA